MKQRVVWGFWVVACLITAAPVGAVVYWTEGFEAYQLAANVGDYADWDSNASARSIVVEDPLDVDNKVLRIDHPSGGQVLIRNNSAGILTPADGRRELKYRIMFQRQTGQVFRFNCGLSLKDAAASTYGYSDYAAHCRARTDDTYDHYDVRDGSVFFTTFTISLNTWYTITYDLDGTTHRYDVYAEGGEFAESTLICSQAAWRSIGDGLVRSFFIITSSDSNQGTVYLDDIQLADPAIEEDTCAAVLADPDQGPLTGDISGPEGEPDCYIDIYDLVALAGQWLMSQ